MSNDTDDRGSGARRTLGVLCGAAVVAVAGCSAGADGPDPSPRPATLEAVASDAGQRWVGTIHSRLTRSNDWLIAGYEAQGDFWFRIAQDGDVTGYAVVSYRPIVNLSGANDILGYARSIGATTLGVAGITAGALGSLVVNGLFGFKYTLPKPMPTRDGAITGELRDDKLRLHWADRGALKIPMRFYADYLTNRELLTKQSFKTESPWPGSATVSSDEEPMRAVEKDGRTTKSGKKGSKVTETHSTYWAAHPVG